MGKCRGFKPQGMVLNPIKRVVSSGPSLMEKLQRESRPTWEELRKILKKKEESASDFLERYENEQFAGQLQQFRNAKIEEQERQHLALVRKEAEGRMRKSNASDISSSSSSTAAGESGGACGDGVGGKEGVSPSKAASYGSRRKRREKEEISVSEEEEEEEGEKKTKKQKETEKQQQQLPGEEDTDILSSSNDSIDSSSSRDMKKTKRSNNSSRKRNSKKKIEKKSKKKKKKKRKRSSHKDSDSECEVTDCIHRGLRKRKKIEGLGEVEIVGTTRNNPYRLSKFFSAVEDLAGDAATEQN